MSTSNCSHFRASNFEHLPCSLVKFSSSHPPKRVWPRKWFRSRCQPVKIKLDFFVIIFCQLQIAHPRFGTPLLQSWTSLMTLLNYFHWTTVNYPRPYFSLTRDTHCWIANPFVIEHLTAKFGSTVASQLLMFRWKTAITDTKLLGVGEI